MYYSSIFMIDDDDGGINNLAYFKAPFGMHGNNSWDRFLVILTYSMFLFFVNLYYRSGQKIFESLLSCGPSVYCLLPFDYSIRIMECLRQQASSHVVN